MSKYELWVTQGQGPGEKPDMEFDTLDEALDFAMLHYYDGSHAIKLPNGEWYDWSTYEPKGRLVRITDTAVASDFVIAKLNVYFNSQTEKVHIGVKEKQ